MASSLSSAPGESGLGLEEEVHVLAVDDSVVELKLIEKLLQNCDFKVTTAASGLQALEYLGMAEELNTPESKKMKVNMIITDYCMPGMTGYELLKKIKESSTMKEIPVVIVSSENIPTRIDKCLKEGAHDFILKPVKQSDVKKLKSYISKFTKSCGASSSMPPNKAKMESLPSDQEFQEAICRAP